MKSKSISVLPLYTYYRRIREGDNKSIMQNLNLRTFKDLIKNFDLVWKEKPKNKLLCNFAWKKANNYIIKNLKFTQALCYFSSTLCQHDVIIVIDSW